MRKLKGLTIPLNAGLASTVEAPQTARPKTRGECIDGPRPCPWVGCKYHLYLDVNPSTGSLKLNFGLIDMHYLHQTCALDIADKGCAVLQEVGRALNLTRERARQIEVKALIELRRAIHSV